MPEPVNAQELVERLGMEGRVTSLRWKALVTHEAACDRRGGYVSAVALMLGEYLSSDGYDAYPAFVTLSARLCMSRRVVSRSVRALEAGAFILDVGHGPDGTTRWNATVPAPLASVLIDVHSREGGLPWRELLPHHEVAGAIVDAFGPVEAYVQSAKARRQDTDNDPAMSDSTTGTTDPTAAPTTGTTKRSADSTAGATDHDPPDDPQPAAPTTDTGGGATVGTRSTRAPTYGSYENGLNTHARTREDTDDDAPTWNPCIHCHKPTRLRTPHGDPVHLHCIPLEATP